MAALSVHEIYTRHIKPLAKRDRLRLLALVVQDLEDETPTNVAEAFAPQSSAVEPAKRSIMELHGLGKEIWDGVDAQEFVNRLRAEWDHNA